MNITDRQLARWLRHQRTRCNDPRQRALLEKIPGWVWNEQTAKWEKGFEQFTKHGVVPYSFETKDGYPLGVWLDVQRRECKDPERIKRLNNITPNWLQGSRHKQWEEGFRQLQKYGVVSLKFITKDGFKLGFWIGNQRRDCKDPERRKRLESIPGWMWDASELANKCVREELKARRKN